MGTFQRSWLTQPRIKTLSSRWLQQYFAFWPHLLEQLPKWASMHKRGKNFFFCSFSSCKYANWCNFQALPLPNLINRSWRHRIVSDFLLLLLLLYIISLAFKIEHCEFEDLLGIFLLSKYLAHSGRMVQYTKKNELAKLHINYESRAIMWYKIPNFEAKKPADLEKTHISVILYYKIDHFCSLKSNFHSFSASWPNVWI